MAAQPCCFGPEAALDTIAGVRDRKGLLHIGWEAETGGGWDVHIKACP